MGSIEQKLDGANPGVPHFSNDNWSEKNVEGQRKSGVRGTLWGKFQFFIEKMKWGFGNDRVKALTLAAIAQIEVERKASGLDYSQIAFVTIDPQVDFVDGAFNVPANPKQVEGKVQALTVASNVSRYLKSKGAYAYATKDHHPADHSSFHTQHGVGPYTLVNIEKNAENHFDAQDKQMAWPVHCVYHGDKKEAFMPSQETEGAKFHSSFDSAHLDAVFTKGINKNVESYSAVFTVYGKEASPLVNALRAEKIAKVYLGGLCTDYCVGHTGGHLALLGFNVSVVAGAVAGISGNALSNLQEAAKLLAVGKWRRDINDSQTAYELEAADGAYQPCGDIQSAISRIKNGQSQPDVQIIQ